MLKTLTLVTWCVRKASIAGAVLLAVACTDMGPTPEISSLPGPVSLPPPVAKPTPPPRPVPGVAVGPRAEEEPAGTHRARAGETVYSIARVYGVDAYALVSLNKLSPPFDLYQGQRLLIPGRGPPSSFVTADPPSRSSRGESTATAGRDVAAGQAETRAADKTLRSQTGSASASAGGGFLWPVEGRIISDFGAKGGGRFNDGINIAAPTGTAVRAADDGVVAYAGNELRGFGNMLLIKHPGGWVTAYAHNQELLVRRGEGVGRGQVIARVGSTGGVDQPQLHFELRKGKKAVDPLDYLRRPSASATPGRDAG